MPSEYNPQLVDNMSAKFRRLNNPAHAMADAVAMLQMFPGVVGIWPGGSTNSSGSFLDVSPNALHLTNNNVSQIINDDLAAYRNLNGSNQYYNRANQAEFDILGTETFMPAQLRGLTIGGWFYFDDASPAAIERFMGTFGNVGTAQLAYLLQRLTATTFRFVVGDGVSSYAAGTEAIANGQWYHLVGRYIPSTSVEAIVNGQVDDTNTTSIPAALLNSAVSFTIGASSVPDSYMDGRASLCFLCAAAVPDIFIDTYFQFTAPLFGVSV